MKQLEITQKTIIRWWRNDDKLIPKDHITQLEQSAKDRVREMVDQGYSSGELNEEIKNISYSGYWEVKELN